MRDHINDYFDEINKIPLLKNEEQFELFKIFAETKDDKLKDKLIKSNLKLVVREAKKYFKFELGIISFMDLINDGNIGLIHAIDKYDYKKGIRFSTYAVHWIRAYIIGGIGNNLRLIKIPNKKRKKIFYNIIYVDFHEEDDKDKYEWAKSDCRYEPFEYAAKRDINRLIEKAIHKLSARERSVIELYYGLNNKKPIVFKKIAEIHKVSFQMIQANHNRAIEKLKRNKALENTLWGGR